MDLKKIMIYQIKKKIHDLFCFFPEAQRDIIANDSVYNNRFNYAVSTFSCFFSFANIKVKLSNPNCPYGYRIVVGFKEITLCVGKFFENILQSYNRDREKLGFKVLFITLKMSN